MKGGDEFLARLKQESIINKLIEECDESIRQSYITLAEMALRWPFYYRTLKQWAYWLELN